MQDCSRRYRLRELLYKKMRQGAVSVGDLNLWLDQLLDGDDELSRALIPEVWRVGPRRARATPMVWNENGFYALRSPAS